jgi:hypothetical protein
MNDESGGTSEETIVANYKALSSHLAGGPEENDREHFEIEYTQKRHCCAKSPGR